MLMVMREPHNFIHISLNDKITDLFVSVSSISEHDSVIDTLWIVSLVSNIDID